MTSLILKDLLNLRSYTKTIIIIILFYGFINYSMDDASFLAGMVILLFTMVPISSFTYDQQAKWDVFGQSLPVTRKEIVLSKYILSGIFLLVGFFISVLMSVMISMVKLSTIDWELIFTTNSSIVVVALVLLSILIPLIYKFGVEKSRFLIMAIILVPIVIAIILSKLGLNIPTETQLNLPTLYGIIMFVAIVIVVISMLTSLKIFQAKDF